MPLPKIKKIYLPLLAIISKKGGSIIVSDAYKDIGIFFNLTEEELLEKTPSGYKKIEVRVRCALRDLKNEGYLVRVSKKTWKITEKGNELLFKTLGYDKIVQEFLQYNTSALFPMGIKKFPVDFIKDWTNNDAFYVINLPNHEIAFAPYSKTLIISVDTKNYYRYEAKNPYEAKYIIYAKNHGVREIKIPKDSFLLYKTVNDYENYCKSVAKTIYEELLQKYIIEDKAKIITDKILKELKISIIQN